MSYKEDELEDSQIELKKVMQSYGENLYDGYSSLNVNIKECDTHVLIEVETPGISKKNITMEIEPTRIEIRAHSGPLKEKHNGLKLRILREERKSGKFKRIIDLPCKININEAVATYHEGVLYIEMAKPDESINRGKRKLNLY